MTAMNKPIRCMSTEDLIAGLRNNELCPTDSAVRVRALAIALSQSLEDRNPSAIAQIIEGLREELIFKSFKDCP